MAEQLICNQQVVGSTPSISSKTFEEILRKIVREVFICVSPLARASLHKHFVGCDELREIDSRVKRW